MTVTFNEAVTGVDVGDFAVTASGVTGASMTGVVGSGTTYTVTVITGTGDGTLRLDVIDDDSILDASGDPLGGVNGADAVGRGDYRDGAPYTIDKTPPAVLSSVRVDPSPSALASGRFTVTFAESVTGVGSADFTLTTTGVSGASVSSVSGSGTAYTVTVATGSGNGTIRLDLADDDSILDTAGNVLGGSGAGNGNYTGGQAYSIEKTPNSEIRGVKWNDLDADGVKDAGEGPLADWTIYLDIDADGQRPPASRRRSPRPTAAMRSRACRPAATRWPKLFPAAGSRRTRCAPRRARRGSACRPAACRRPAAPTSLP